VTMGAVSNVAIHQPRKFRRVKRTGRGESAIRPEF
jgi:hypothetical protein